MQCVGARRVRHQPIIIIVVIKFSTMRVKNTSAIIYLSNYYVLQLRHCQTEWFCILLTKMSLSELRRSFAARGVSETSPIRGIS